MSMSLQSWTSPACSKHPAHQRSHVQVPHAMHVQGTPHVSSPALKVLKNLCKHGSCRASLVAGGCVELLLQAAGALAGLPHQSRAIKVRCGFAKISQMIPADWGPPFLHHQLPCFARMSRPNLGVHLTCAHERACAAHITGAVAAEGGRVAAPAAARARLATPQPWQQPPQPAECDGQQWGTAGGAVS